MSNYLENLIGKNFNRLAIARPRLASRFESLPQGSGPAAGQSAALQSREQQALADGDTPPQDRPARMNQEAPANPRLTPADRLAEAPETTFWRGKQALPVSRQEGHQRQRVAPQTAGPGHSEPPSQNPVGTGKRPEEFSAQRLAAAKLNLFSAPPGPQTDRVIGEPEKPDRRPAVQPVEPAHRFNQTSQVKAETHLPEAPNRGSSAIRRPINAPQAEARERDAEPIDRAFARQSDRRTVEPRAALRRESQLSGEGQRRPLEKAAGQAEAPALPPTINVTIGRIEVRATAPPSAAPRQQKRTAPTMSLEEYLRRRDRGGAK
jgi:hypothetical protein